MKIAEEKAKPRSSVLYLEGDKFLGELALAKKKEEEEEEDEIDKTLKELTKSKIMKLKSLEVDKYLLQTEKEVEELKKDVEKKKNPEESEITPETAMALAKLPEEQRNLVIQTYTMLKSAEKGGGAMAYMLPMLIGFAKANPQAQQNDMVKFAELVTNQIKTGMELARANQPQPTQLSFDPIALVKTFAEVIRDNVQKPLEEVVERIQPQPSALEQLLLDDKLFERAKTLGMFGGGGGQPQQSDILLEIEKLRTERDLKIQEMEQEHKKWLAEHRLEEQKWQQLGSIFQGPVGNVLETLGRAGADRIRTERGAMPQAQAQAQPQIQIQIPGVKVEQIQCPKCQKPFYANVLADYVICAHCGSILAKSGGTEQSEQTTTTATTTTEESQSSQ